MPLNVESKKYFNSSVHMQPHIIQQPKPTKIKSCKTFLIPSKMIHLVHYWIMELEMGSLKGPGGEVDDLGRGEGLEDWGT